MRFNIPVEAGLDDRVIWLGNEPFGGLCRAGAWSAFNRFDGFVPARVAKMFAKPKSWERLASNPGSMPGREAVLNILGQPVLGQPFVTWVDEPEPGWQIIDWLDWQCSGREQSAYRARKAKEQRLRRQLARLEALNSTVEL